MSSEKVSFRDLLSVIVANRARKCPLRLLDTIYFGENEASPSWYFTTKAGVVSRKKGDNARITNVADRFKRFALANPGNKAGIVGVIVDGTTGARKELSEDALRRLLDRDDPVALDSLQSPHGDSFLQVYLRPKGGEMRLLALNYEASGVPSSSSSTSSSASEEGTMAFSSTSMLDGTSSLSSFDGHSDFTRGQLQGFAGEMVEYLRSTANLRVDNMCLQFVVDDNDHAWLSSIPTLTVSPAQALPAATSERAALPNLSRDQEGSAGTGDGMHASDAASVALNTGTSSAPSSRPTSAPRGDSAKRNARERHAQGHTRGERERDEASNSSSGGGGNRSRTGNPLGQSVETLGLGTSELVSKEGSVYRASRGPDELPGLRAWSLASLSDDDRMGWAVDLLEYTSLPSPTANLADLRRRRAETRVVATYRFVALTRQAERLLVGNEHVETEEDFIDLWKQALLKTSASDPAGGRLQSQVTVDGNLFGICRKLEALVDANFQATAQLPARDSPVIFDPDVKRPPSSSSRPMSGPDGRRLSADDMRTASAGSNIDPLDDDDVLAGLAAADRAQAALTGHKDLANGAKAAKVGRDLQQKKKKKKKPTPYEMPVQGDPSADVKPPNRFSKKNDMDAPPNIELMAKFAAEKERLILGGKPLQEKASRKKAGDKKKATHGDYEMVAMGGGLLEDSGELEDFMKKARRSRKKGNKDYDPKVEEARLAELERLAEMAKEQFHKGQPQQMGMMGPGGLAQGSLGSLAAGSVLSDVEADFMSRQAAFGTDLNQFSSVGMGGLEDGSQIHGSPGGNGGALRDNIQDKLKQRVEALEKEKLNMQQILSRRNNELEMSEAKIRDLRGMLESQRLATEGQVRSMEQDHRKDIMALKEAHASEMATVLAAANEREDAEDADGSHSGTTAGAVGGETTSKFISKAEARHQAEQMLMDQIEKLRRENKRLLEEHSVDRRAIADDLKGKAMVTESSLRSEISELRARAVNLEDDLKQAEDNTVAANAKADNISRLCKQLEQDRKDAIDQQDQLRADLANMQQSVAASYRLESEQGIGVGLDADTAIKMSEAKAEAKERQLTNKIEFLKAQLSAEQATTEELKKDQHQARVEMEEMKDEFKKRFKELEKDKQGAIDETERLVEQRYEERMTELTTLQAKMQLLNAQLQDSFQEGSLSKQREDAAKAATAKALAHQAAMKNENDGLRRQVEELRDKQDDLMSRESGRQNSEAMLRRLDNERQYLKSQLSSEITHKNELQVTLNNVQAQLAEAQRQWKLDVETLKNKQVQITNTTTQRDQRSMQTTLHLQSENERLEKANAELREGFNKTRDLLRAEQLNLENTKSSGKRMLEELEQAREDVARLRQEIEDDAEIHRQQREAMHQSLKELDARRVSETKNLRDEISKQYAATSAAQKEALHLTEQLRGVSGTQSSQLYALRVFQGLHRWRRNRLYEFFRKWSVNSTLVEMARQFRTQVDDMVAGLHSEAEDAQRSALEDQRATLKDEEERRVEALHLDSEKSLEQARREERAAAAELAEVREEEFRAEMQQKDEHWAMEVDLAVRAGEANVASAEQRAEMKMIQLQERFEVDKKDAQFAADKKLADALSVAKFSKDEEWAKKLAEREVEMTNNKDELAKLITDEGQARLDALREEKDKEHAEALAEREKVRLEELKSATDAADNALRMLKERMMHDHAKKIEDLGDDHADAMRAQRAEMHESNEARVQELKAAWMEEKAQELAAKDEEIDELLEKRLSEQAKVHERDMAQVVKLEAAKWQQALREAEKRFRLEAKQAHGEGWAARDRDAQDEILKLKSDWAMKEGQLAERHRLAAAELARDHASAMASQEERLVDEREREVNRTERETTAVVEAEWSDKMKKRIDEVWAEAADMWQPKLDREADKLEKFKAETSAERTRIAEERAELLQRVAQSDELLKNIEDLNTTEVRKMQEQHQKALDALTAKLEKVKGQTVRDVEVKAAEQLEQAERAFREEMASMLKLERDRTTENMEAQMRDVQDESERMIKRLEKAVEGLKEERSKLQGDISELQTKCEDTEDALYDAQKDQKAKDKANSMAIWKSITNMTMMRLRFQKGMENFDKEAATTLEKVQRKAQSKTEQVTLTAMQYSGAMVAVEKARLKLHDVLVNFKQDALIEKRTQIKMLERDLDKFTAERDNLEEQRETMEEETAGLEAQVRELEEQIRDHNRSSSMTNGRINVAHARKKRRLDSELERILELIEQRRIQISDLDEKVAQRGAARDEKESRMIDLEKELVGVLLEQQKKVLMLVEDMSFEEKNRTLCSVAGFPWPPAKINPTMGDVKALRRERQAAEEEKAKEREREGLGSDDEDDAAGDN